MTSIIESINSGAEIGEQFQHKIGAFALLFRRNLQTGEIEILLVRRNDIKVSTKNGEKYLLNLPGGGVEKNEQLRDGLVREVTEETGLKVRVIGSNVVYDSPRSADSLVGSEGREDIFCFSICSIQSGTLTTSSEATDFGWYALNELPPELFERHRLAINHAVMAENDSIERAIAENAITLV